MHLKVFVKLKNTLKTPSSGQKNPKKTKKPKKTQKKPKKPTGLGFFLKPGFFPTLISTYASLQKNTRKGSKQTRPILPFETFRLCQDQELKTIAEKNQTTAQEL